MNYDEMKDLLLSNEDLGVNQALDILNYIDKYPEAYSALLDEDGAYVYLKKYSKCKSGKHVFECTKNKIIAPNIFYKFAKIGDPDVDVGLWETLIGQMMNNGDDVTDVYQWPYMNKSILEDISIGLIAQVVVGYHFVFNFENDEFGYLFKIVHDKLKQTGVLPYLAVSSFNLYGWAMHEIEENNFYRAQQMLFANHCFEEIAGSSQGAVTEAHMRKFIIKYFYDVDLKTPEMGAILMLEKSKKCN